MELSIEHSLSEEDVARRIAELCARHGIDHVPDAGARSGSVSKATPLGMVRALYRIEPRRLVIDVQVLPAFLPQGAVRRAVEESVRKALTG